MRRIARLLPFIAAALAFTAVFVWLDRDKQFSFSEYPAGSLHATFEKGCSLAFRYLKATRSKEKPVAELNRTLGLADVEPGAVIFRIDPQHVPGEHEDPEKKALAPAKPAPKIPDAPKTLLTPAEESWIKGGGRLVLAIQHPYGPLETETLPKGIAPEKVFPIWPDVKELHLPAARTLKGAPLSETITLLSFAEKPLAARLPLGGGEVILIATPEIFENGNIDQNDNLRLLEALAPPGRAVYFDEFVHGLNSSPGMLEMLNSWGLGMALLVALSAGACAVWRAAAPIGPPEDDYKETRTQALDFVASLAPLYDHALQPQQAIALHYKNFVHALTVQSALRGAELHAKMLELLGGADPDIFTSSRPISNAELGYLLKTLNEAFGRLERAHRR